MAPSRPKAVTTITEEFVASIFMVKVKACPEDEGRLMQNLCNYLKDDIAQKTII